MTFNCAKGQGTTTLSERSLLHFAAMTAPINIPVFPLITLHFFIRMGLNIYGIIITITRTHWNNLFTS